MASGIIQQTQTAALRQTHSIIHAGWVYPLRGIYYFATHSFLWPVIRARLIPCFFLSAFIFSTLFIWTYIPQWAFLALFHGWHGAWLNATFLVLGEGVAITALLFEAFLVDETQVDIFDAVLVNEGYSNLVETTRPVDATLASPIQRLGKPHHASVYAPFSLRQIVEFICLLPLNFIPWIGVPLFLWITGRRAGPFNHWRYFQLKEFTKDKRKQFIKKRRLQYTGFGTVSLVLQLIPVASMLFLLTTSAGSALWAVDVEKRQRNLAEAQGAGSDAGEAPPEYSEYVDNPV